MVCEPKVLESVFTAFRTNSNGIPGSYSFQSFGYLIRRIGDWPSFAAEFNAGPSVSSDIFRHFVRNIGAENAVALDKVTRPDLLLHGGSISFSEGRYGCVLGHALGYGKSAPV